MADAHSSSSSLLMLESFSASLPPSGLFNKFHEFALSTFERLSISPTYVGIGDLEGKAPEKLVKFNGKTYRRYLREGFRNVIDFSLVAHPKDSDVPSWDAFAEIYLGFAPNIQYASFYFHINEAYLRFGTPEYEQIYEEALQYNPWQYGWGYAAPANKLPWLFMFAFSNDKVTSKAEEESLTRWRQATEEDKQRKLRDLYTYNFMSDSHLQQEVQPGQTLREFILQQRSTEFRRLTDYGLYLWKITDESLQAELREYLGKRGVLISAIGPPGRT